MYGSIPVLRLPRWVTTYAATTYFFALAIVSLIYLSHCLPWYFMVSGGLSVTLFFLYGRQLTREMSVRNVRKPSNFAYRVFVLSFILRIATVLMLYWIFLWYYDHPFGFEDADATYYDSLGAFVADLMRDGNFHFYTEIARWSGHEDVSDMGYGIYLGLVYLLTGRSVLAARVLKCVWSSLTVVLVYRLAQRNFGEQIARVAALFCALWPNFWYYCTAHLKETEMVFLIVLYIEQADQMLRSRQFTAWKIIPVLLIAALIFTFRTPLGLVALLALVFALVMSSSGIVSWGKRVIVGLLAVTLIGVGAGERIEERVNILIEKVRGGEQRSNMEWRSEREHGNVFAKYASSAVFAPMIFTLPFPTMVEPYEGQYAQQMLNGGNYIKNIMSFFTILALFTLLLSGYWRNHALILGVTLGYVVVLTLSSFAHSERFHQPVMPFEFIFMAYGLTVAMTDKKYKRWFFWWCGIMLLAAVLWNLFKMKGQGV